MRRKKERSKQGQTNKQGKATQHTHVAQLVGHLSRTQEVAGLNPTQLAWLLEITGCFWMLPYAFALLSHSYTAVCADLTWQGLWCRGCWAERPALPGCGSWWNAPIHVHVAQHTHTHINMTFGNWNVSTLQTVIIRVVQRSLKGFRFTKFTLNYSTCNIYM